MTLTRRTYLTSTAACAVVLLAAGPLGLRSAFAQDWDPAITEFDAVMGDPDAPVTLIEYASFTCGHCANFATDTFDELKTRFIDTGQLRFVFRDFPLDGLALRAGMLARCVEGVDYFAVIHELFASQRQWATADDPVEALQRIGQLAGLSEEAFLACMDNDDLANQIIQLRLDGEEQYNVRATPTFVLNGHVFSGALPLDEFVDRIEQQLQS